MRKHNQLLVALALLLSGWSCASAGSLSFKTPAGWDTFDQFAGGRHFYWIRTLDRKAEDHALLLFHPTLTPPKPKDIPAYVRDLVDRFAQAARTNVSLAVSTNEYRIQQLSGADCAGSYATFEFTNSIGRKFTSAVFAMSVGGEV